MAKRIKVVGAPEARIYLAQWRKTKFPTQTSLADAMNTTAAAVSRIETGKREWNKGYLEALAYLVGCQVPDLFEKPDIIRNTRGLDEAMRLVAKLREDQIDGLIAFLGGQQASAPSLVPVVEDPPVRKAKAK
jgi:hypothetical protein